ncbi:hypothetical protein K458DRAFT_431091 [Lentithecium fluviatile CBS 122367]|uniref:Uncharacterized protein n=1 Tax=Lentithecium fluviatile CBS 122367 TaxID=1168545 RepID=A0A6G1J2P9_9PLEO|nr:hypothetical protein K458DRAFT_431091 [Lentithecium fluviatile CBS 122367]
MKFELIAAAALAARAVSGAVIKRHESCSTHIQETNPDYNQNPVALAVDSRSPAASPASKNVVWVTVTRYTTVTSGSTQGSTLRSTVYMSVTSTTTVTPPASSGALPAPMPSPEAPPVESAPPASTPSAPPASTPAPSAVESTSLLAPPIGETTIDSPSSPIWYSGPNTIPASTSGSKGAGQSSSAAPPSGGSTPAPTPLAPASQAPGGTVAASSPMGGFVYASAPASSKSGSASAAPSPAPNSPATPPASSTPAPSQSAVTLTPIPPADTPAPSPPATTSASRKSAVSPAPSASSKDLLGTLATPPGSSTSKLPAVAIAPVTTANLGKRQADAWATPLPTQVESDSMTTIPSSKTVREGSVTVLPKRSNIFIRPRIPQAGYPNGFNPGLYDEDNLPHVERRAAEPATTIKLPGIEQTLDGKPVAKQTSKVIVHRATRSSPTTRSNSTPSPRPSSSSRKPSPSPSNTSKPSPAPTPKPTSSTKSSNSDGEVKTVVLSQDPRCPYPYPGVNCGTPITTLTTAMPKKTGARGKKLTWKQTLVVVLSGEVAMKTSSTQTVETLTVVRSADIVVRTRPVVATLVVTHPPALAASTRPAAAPSVASTTSCGWVTVGRGG